MSDEQFVDKKNREITLRVDDAGSIFRIIADHEENEAGIFTYDVREVQSKYETDYYYELTHMNIEPDYQRAGIGLEMLRYGEYYFDGKIVYPEDGTENYPTLEGAALLNKAFGLGIIRVLGAGEDQPELENDDHEYEYLAEDSVDKPAFIDVSDFITRPATTSFEGTLADFAKLVGDKEDNK